MRRLESVFSLFLVSARRRGTLAALVMTAFAAGGAYWVVQPIARVFETAIIKDNPGWYLEMATNLAWCGRYPFVTSTMPASQAKVSLMRVQLELVGSQTLRSVIVRGAGSLAQYCRLGGTRMVLPEASIVLAEAALLAANRRITVEGIGWGLAWIAAAQIALFAFGLLKSRWPMLFAAASVTSALYLTALLGSTALYSQYRLMLPTTLSGIGLGAWALASGVHRRRAGLVGVAFVLGVWAAILGNVRTSHYPIGLAIVCLFVAFGVFDVSRQAGRSRAQLAAAAAGALTAAAIGIAAFEVPFISPQRASGGYAYHVIAHPLVLGLALPPNELTAREHIEWDDGSGMVAARKVDPSVQYLGPGYERALFTYYRRLWRNNFREMAGIYVRKLSVARLSAEKFLSSDQQGEFWFHKDGRWLPRAAWPALRIAGAVGVVGLFAGLFSIGCARPAFADIDLPKGFCLSAIAAAGLVSFAEAAVIMPTFVLQYSSVFLFALVFAGLFVYQAVLDAVWRLVSARLARPRALHV